MCQYYSSTHKCEIYLTSGKITIHLILYWEIITAYNPLKDCVSYTCILLSALNLLLANFVRYLHPWLHSNTAPCYNQSWYRNNYIHSKKSAQGMLSKSSIAHAFLTTLIQERVTYPLIYSRTLSGCRVPFANKITTHLISHTQIFFFKRLHLAGHVPADSESLWPKAPRAWLQQATEAPCPAHRAYPGWGDASPSRHVGQPIWIHCLRLHGAVAALWDRSCTPTKQPP